MSTFNSGTITVKQNQIKAVAEILRKHGISEIESCWASSEKKEIYYSLKECYGDMEVGLRNALEDCRENGLSLSFYIEFDNGYDGGSGAYTVEDGEFLFLSKEEIIISNAETEHLIKELEKRGYAISKVSSGSEKTNP